jgi:hypothetical protein
MSICHGYPMPTRLHSYHLAIITSPHCLPNSVLGDQMLCTLTIGAPRGPLILSRQCARFRFSPLFIQPKEAAKEEMFLTAIPRQFILLNHGLPIHRSV